MSLIGKRYTLKKNVTENDTALALGSGEVTVLSTARLIAWLENCACKLLEDHLEEGQTTVGTHIDLNHLSPTPVGGYVTLEAIVTKETNTKVTFELVANDCKYSIASATHTRFIVDKEKFTAKAYSKLNQ
jgi:predicted thioesterase